MRTSNSPSLLAHTCRKVVFDLKIALETLEGNENETFCLGRMTQESLVVSFDVDKSLVGAPLWGVLAKVSLSYEFPSLARIIDDNYEGNFGSDKLSAWVSRRAAVFKV